MISPFSICYCICTVEFIWLMRLKMINWVVMNYDIGKLSLKELRKKLNDEFKCAQRKSGSVIQFPQISHRIERSIKKKYDRVHFNYLDRDALLSTIYRALETNARYINCLDVQKLFHSTTILYLVNNWFVSFNWHYLYLIILH